MKYKIIQIDNSIKSEKAKKKLIISGWLCFVLALFFLGLFFLNQTKIFYLTMNFIFVAFYLLFLIWYNLKFVLLNNYKKIGEIHFLGSKMYLNNEGLNNSIVSCKLFYLGYRGQDLYFKIEKFNRNNIFSEGIINYSKGIQNYIYIEYANGEKIYYHILLENKKQYQNLLNFFNANYPNSIEKSTRVFEETENVWGAIKV